MSTIRLAVIGASESGARDISHWVTSGEKIGDDFEKTYSINDVSMTVKPFPVWNEGTTPVSDGILIICKTTKDLPGVESIVSKYKRVPIKFILYEGAGGKTEYEEKWMAEGHSKETPEKFIEKLMDADYEVVHVVTAVINAFDKSESGAIDTSMIETVVKAMGSDISKSEAEQAGRQLDVTNIGKVSAEVFIDWWKSGRRGSADKMAATVKEIIKKEDLLTKFNEKLEPVRAVISSSGAVKDGSFAVYLNKTAKPKFCVEVKVMTKSKELETEFQTFSKGLELKPKEPFIALAVKAKNPKAVKEKLEGLVGDLITMMKAGHHEALEAMNFVDFKYITAGEKAVVCLVPSASGSSALVPILEFVNNFIDILRPDLLAKASLGFAIDLSQVATEYRPFYALLMDGVNFELSFKLQAGLIELMNKAKEIFTSEILPKIPPPFYGKLEPMTKMDAWFKAGNVHLDMDVDDDIRNAVDSLVPPPAAIPVRSLKQMIAPKIKEEMPKIPLAEKAYNLCKEEVISIELMIYLGVLAGMKLTLNLPGLPELLKL